MRKAIKFILLLLMLSALVSMLVISALGVSPKVYDKAQLFSAQEMEALEARANAFAERLQLDIVIVTTNENDGKTSRAYADDFYDQNGFGYGADADGILMLINMEDREVYISTCGIAIRYFTDARIESVLDRVYPFLGEAKYAEAADVFLSQVEYYVGVGIPSNQYTAPEGGGGLKSVDPVKRIIISLLIALGVGGVTVGIMAMHNKGTSTVNHSTYLQSNSFNLINSQDIHVNTSVTHVTISSSSGSGGGRSSTHSSSSGRSHGGGGRKF